MGCSVSRRASERRGASQAFPVRLGGLCYGIAAWLAIMAPAAGAQQVTVVVNAANPVSVLSQSQMSNIFLKKIVTWPNGRIIEPVDQNKRSGVRIAFSKVIHRRSPATVETYWQTQIFSGKNVPPAALSGDEAVLAFVRNNANAIGYVSAGAKLGEGVKALTVK